MNASGAHVIGVISDETKRDYVLGLGAKGVINRKDFGIDIEMPLEGGGVVVGDKITITLEIEAGLQV